MPSNREHNVDRFIIVGEFQEISYLNKYESPNSIIEHKKSDNITPFTQYYTTWSFSHVYPTPVSPPDPSYFETNAEIENIDYRGKGCRISNVLTVYGLNIAYNVVIITNAEGRTFIYIPYISSNGVAVPNPVLKDATVEEFYKLSCSAISMNKSLKNIINS